MGFETFWTIVSYAVLLGVGALVGFVFYYWFVAVPDRVTGRPGKLTAGTPAARRAAGAARSRW